MKTVFSGQMHRALTATFLTITLATTSGCVSSQQSAESQLSRAERDLRVVAPVRAERNVRPAELSREERDLRAIEAKRVNQSVAVGCLAGSVVGVLIAKEKPTVKIGDYKIPTAALIGSIGCIGGKLSGDYVNARSRDLGGQQKTYQAMIAAADSDIARYRSLNKMTSRLIAQKRQEISSLNAQYSAGTLTAAQYRSNLSSAESNMKIIDSQNREMSQQIKVMRGDSNALRSKGQSTSALDQRIKSLETERNNLERDRLALVKTYNDVPPAVGRVKF